MRKWILSRPDKYLGRSKAGEDVSLDSPDLKVYGGRAVAMAAEAKFAKDGEQYRATTLVLAKAYAKPVEGPRDDIPF